MHFFDRAKSMHERGEAVRASVILAEGLKREPEHVEALEWLLHLYVEELPNPGMEREILQILRAQHNARELYDIVRAELRDLGQHAKLGALEQVVDRDGLALDEPPGESDDEADESSAALHGETDPADSFETASTNSKDQEEDWGSFDNPLSRETAPDAQPDPVPDESAPPELAPPPVDANESVAALAASVAPPAKRRVSKSTTSRRVVPDRTLLAIGVVALFIGLAIVAFAIFANRDDSPTSDESDAAEGSAETQEALETDPEGSSADSDDSPGSETVPEEP